ncbi:hypothetical protein [Taibaiella koreensis]|uniref:hypothetical protein n=1 Tax=Taibaiella koreensis TaxID=1268548 RepID=UPI0013C2C7C6|nr:hypothetical protein [Taibaiella koreensis]
MIGCLICSLASVYLFRGCGHQDEQSLKQLLSEKKDGFTRIQAIKRRLFQQHDSMGSFTVEYTGRMFRFSFRRFDEANDRSAAVCYFLSDEEVAFFRSFMNGADIYYIFLYRDRETYSFLGCDCMDITDGTYRDNGIEIARNVYFRPWSAKNDQ